MKNLFGLILLNSLSRCFLPVPSVFGKQGSCEDLPRFKMEGCNLTINKVSSIPEGKLPPSASGVPAMRINYSNPGTMWMQV